MIKNIDRYLGSVLPENFQEINQEFEQIQAFLKRYFQSPQNELFQLKSCHNHKLVISAANPQAAGFFKMHQADFLKAINTRFAIEYRILLQTRPSHQIKPRAKKLTAKTSSDGAVAIGSAAQQVSDEALSQALLRLQKSLQKT